MTRYRDAFPNTSYLNVSEPVSSSGFSGEPVSNSGGGMFDPVTLGLGIANIGASIFGANEANRTRAEIANAKLAVAAYEPVWKTMLGREQAKGQMSAELGNRNTLITTAPDIEFGRQREAAMFAAGPLAERQLALDTDRARRQFALGESEDVRKQRQRENRESLKRTFAEKQAQMAGTFGRIAPQDVSTYFV